MKKTISILLGVVLVLGLGLAVPASMVAEDRIIHVPGDHPTIQEAIDAARDGDTIEVASGEYAAFSVIGRSNISVVGAEGATVTAGHSFSINRGPIGDAWTMAAVKDSRNISIRGLAFDGTALGGLNGDHEVVVGIAYINSTGTVADLKVEHTMGTEMGVGVAIIGDAGASVVNVAGVEVRNSMAGVVVWDAEAELDGCTITGMRPNLGFGIMSTGAGVVAGIPGDAWRGPSTVKIKGSTISENNDVGIYVSDASVVEAHFNTIVGNAVFGVFNDGGQRVDALYNWWGGMGAGPLHASNPAGLGNNAVSDHVDFKPWAGAPVITGTVTDGIIGAMAEDGVEVEVTGTARVTITKYLSDPGADVTGQFVTQGESFYGDVPGVDQARESEVTGLAMAVEDVYPLGRWVDVRISDTSQAPKIVIRMGYRSDELDRYPDLLQWRMHWLKDGTWTECSNTNIAKSDKYPGYAGYIWAEIDKDSRPSLTQLTGTAFGGYGRPPIIPKYCSIATAAYGTDAAAEIEILREFRDVVLLPNSPGSALVSIYYRTSPPVADIISRYAVLRAAMRVGLVDPIVAVLNWSQGWWSVTGS